MAKDSGRDAGSNRENFFWQKNKLKKKVTENGTNTPPDQSQRVDSRKAHQ